MKNSGQLTNLQSLDEYISQAILDEPAIPKDKMSEDKFSDMTLKLQRYTNKEMKLLGFHESYSRKELIDTIIYLIYGPNLYLNSTRDVMFGSLPQFYPTTDTVSNNDLTVLDNAMTIEAFNYKDPKDTYMKMYRIIKDKVANAYRLSNIINNFL